MHMKVYQTSSEYFLLNQLSQQQIFDSPKLKEFEDDDFKFDENDKKFSKQVENAGYRSNCSLQAISPILRIFFKRLLLQKCINQGFF